MADKYSETQTRTAIEEGTIDVIDNNSIELINLDNIEGVQRTDQDEQPTNSSNYENDIKRAIEDNEEIGFTSNVNIEPTGQVEEIENINRNDSIEQIVRDKQIYAATENNDGSSRQVNSIDKNDGTEENSQCELTSDTSTIDIFTIFNEIDQTVEKDHVSDENVNAYTDSSDDYSDVKETSQYGQISDTSNGDANVFAIVDSDQKTEKEHVSDTNYDETEPTNVDDKDSIENTVAHTSISSSSDTDSYEQCRSYDSSAEQINIDYNDRLKKTSENESVNDNTDNKCTEKSFEDNLAYINRFYNGAQQTKPINWNCFVDICTVNDVQQVNHDNQTDSTNDNNDVQQASQQDEKITIKKPDNNVTDNNDDSERTMQDDNDPDDHIYNVETIDPLEIVTRKIEEDDSQEDDNQGDDNQEVDNKEVEIKEIDRKLFIGGLDKEITKSNLKEHFNCFGDIVNITIKDKSMMRRTDRFAFITFKTIDGVHNTLGAHNHVINGKKYYPKNAIKRQEKLFVHGLPYDVTKDEIKEFFEKWGTIINLEVPIFKITNKNKGYCFITYEYSKEVQNLLMSGKQKMKDKFVEVKKYQPWNSNVYLQNIRGRGTSFGIHNSQGYGYDRAAHGGYNRFGVGVGNDYRHFNNGYPLLPHPDLRNWQNTGAIPRYTNLRYS